MGTRLGEFLGKPVHSQFKPCPDFIIPDAKVGIEVEVENCRTINGLDEALWANKEDGSLRNHGMEFVTNGGLIGYALKHAIEHICSVSKKNKYDIGEDRAGIHIHLDVTDLDFEANDLLRLVINYLIVEHMMFGYAEDGRTNFRSSCGYCIPYYLGQYDFDHLGRFLTCTTVSRDSKIVGRDILRDLSKYQALNLRPLVDLGTIEFRALPTTFDPDRIKFWINTILAIKQSATDKRFDNPLKLLSTLGPQLFCERILTEPIYEKLRGYLSEAQVWRAVDNAQTIIAIGKQRGLFDQQQEKNLNPKGKMNEVMEARKKRYDEERKKSGLDCPAQIQKTLDSFLNKVYMHAVLDGSLNNPPKILAGAWGQAWIDQALPYVVVPDGVKKVDKMWVLKTLLMPALKLKHEQEEAKRLREQQRLNDMVDAQVAAEHRRPPEPRLRTHTRVNIAAPREWHIPELNAFNGQQPRGEPAREQLNRWGGILDAGNNPEQALLQPIDQPNNPIRRG